jgi:nucleoside-diphosphate-sugar epimerase
MWDLCNRFSLAQNEECMEFQGTGNEVRDWVHVFDVCTIIYRLIKSDASGVINIGSGRAVTVRQVIEFAASEWFGENIQPQIVFNNASRDGDPNILLADLRILQKYINKFDFTLIEEGVKEYVSWYRSGSVSS